MKSPDEKDKLRTWIEIDKKAIKTNYDSFRKIIDKKCKLLAVVKSNAYGNGLKEFSVVLEGLGVDWFGVDSIVEANSLKEWGIKKPILVLGYTLPTRLEEAYRNDFSITVSDLTSLNNIKKLGEKLRGLKIHIKVDTGMHRQGFFLQELPQAIKILKKMPYIKVEGIYTHFSSAKHPEDRKETTRQINEFQKAVELFESKGFVNMIRHASATAGTIIFKEAHFDMVRVGIGFSGLWPSRETEKFYRDKIKLSPVLSWKTIVSQIKYLPKGSRIGYDLSEKLVQDSKVAVLPIGYWHGFPRILSSRGKVSVKGVIAKVLGRVSMDMVSVDVTNIKNIKVGDVVVLVGKDKFGSVAAKDMASMSGSTEYEVLTRLNPLIRRIMV